MLKLKELIREVDERMAIMSLLTDYPGAKAYKAIGGSFPEHSDEYKERQRDASRTQRLINMGGLPGAWLEEGWRKFLNAFGGLCVVGSMYR